MNSVQLIRRARLGCDALLPSGAVSSMWGDDEALDTLNEAYEEIFLRFRLARKKWGLVTVRSSDPAFTRDGETYNPGANLIVGAAANNAPPKLLLPPDFGEMVRVYSDVAATSVPAPNMTIRFLPADMESFHWIDMEMGSYNTTGQGVIPSTPDGLTFYWDITDNRHMILIPPTTQTFPCVVDYIPMKRPLYYTGIGGTSPGTVTVTGGSTIVTGTGTSFQSGPQPIFSESTQNACELILGTNIAQDNSGIVLLNADYPRVASIDSDTQVTLVQNATAAMSGATQQYILTMAPALPRTYHRWIARLCSAMMLVKVSPQLSEQYSSVVKTKFDEYIQPTSQRRQSQESRVTEDSEEMGVTSEW